MPNLPPAVTLPPQTVVGNAATDAEPAEAIPFNFLAPMLIGYLQDTSTSSVTIGTGSLTFQLSTGKAFAPGQFVTISDQANAANFVNGSVTSYNASTGVLVLNSLATGGSGTKAAWNVALSGPQGQTGSTGPAGPSYPAAQYSYTSAQTAPTGDASAEFFLGGNAFYTLTFGAASGYPAKYTAIVTNKDTAAGKTIAPNGGTSFILYPGQTCRLINTGSAWLVDAPNRWKNSAVTFYVDPSLGSDSNDGLAAGSGRAFATIQHAVNTVRQFVDCMEGPPTIQLADGTHDVGSGVNLDYPLVGSGQLLITGNQAAPNNVKVQCNGGGSCFSARDLSTTTLSYMDLQTIGNGSVLVNCTQGATVDLNGVNFEATPSGTHIFASTFASVNILGNYSINGPAAIHLNVANSGYINYGSFTVTGASGMTFGSAFAEAINSGTISAGGVPMTFSGFASVTGQRYAVAQNAVIVSNGMVFPGNSAGTTATGGQYI